MNFSKTFKEMLIKITFVYLGNLKCTMQKIDISYYVQKIDNISKNIGEQKLALKKHDVDQDKIIKHTNNVLGFGYMLNELIFELKNDLEQYDTTNLSSKDRLTLGQISEFMQKHCCSLLDNAYVLSELAFESQNNLKQSGTMNLSSKNRFSLAEVNKTTQEYSVNLVYDLKKANIAIDNTDF